MPRPPVEVADVIRTAGESFFECRPKWFSWLHLKVLHAILCCRTVALGGHADACSKCGHEAVSYNSCRNRHCPKCQANARDRWLEARAKELLPTRYVHVVFRGKFVDGLRTLHAEHKLDFHGTLAVLRNPKAFAAWLRPLFRSPWVVYAKRPFGGAQHALRYLGQYTHRVAISNHRLVALV